MHLYFIVQMSIYSIFILIWLEVSTYPLFDYYPKRMYLKEYRQYSCFVLRLLSKRLEILQC